MDVQRNPDRPLARRTALVATVFVLLLALVPLVLALEGPVLPPPGGVTITQSGACEVAGKPVGECIGRTDGVDDAFTTFDLSQSDVLYWGPEDASAVGLAFDCTINAAGETMTFNAAQSDLANGMARWLGSAEVEYWTGSSWTTVAVPTRFTLNTSDGGGSVAMLDGSALGIAGTAMITVTGDFESNMLMEAYWSSAWQPTLEWFDDLHTRPEDENCAISNVEHGFYYDDVPIAGLSATNDSPTPLSSSTQLTATIAAGTDVSYAWDLGDGDTGSGASVGHIYPAVGTYTATVTATNSAGYTATTTLVTVEEAIAGLAATNDSPTKVGETTTLTATITAGTNVSYTWDLGDGETGSGAVVSHIYPSVALYTATVTASNSVGYTATTTLVTVGEHAISGLSATNDSPTELGETTMLTATIAVGTNVTYTWDLGDGETGSGAAVAHIYPEIGTYTATVTATNALGFTAATTLVTVDEAIAGLAATNDGPTKVGELTTLIATITAGTGVTYTWDLGDGATDAGAIVSHIYPATGAYTAVVTATNSVGFATATTIANIIGGDVYIYLPVVWNQVPPPR